ncbi:MAG: hypothetical protein AAF572_03505 [Cyanobacteria bacterium P01_B01_bin.77]
MSVERQTANNGQKTNNVRLHTLTNVASQSFFRQPSVWQILLKAQVPLPNLQN